MWLDPKRRITHVVGIGKGDDMFEKCNVDASPFHTFLTVTPGQWETPFIPVTRDISFKAKRIPSLIEDVLRNEI
jgi:hypothetical protein